MSVGDPGQDQDPIEQLLLTAYPNPERKGCPGRDVLARLAGQDRDPDDSDWYHVWHCSPCYSEFKEMRDGRWHAEGAHDQKRRRMTWAAVAAAALVLIVSGAVWWLQKNLREAPVEIAQITLNLFDVDAQRDVGQNHNISLPPLPRKVDNVQIILPRFSDGGEYTVAVLKSRDPDSALALAKASTVMDERRLLLSIRFDLSRATPGTYLLGTRLEGRDQIYYYPLRIE